MGGGRTREIVVPSVVTADPQGGLVAGAAAARLAEQQPELGVESVKRLIGRRVGTPEIEWLAASTPQLLAQAPSGIGVQVAGTLYSAQALAHALLRHVVDEAEHATRTVGGTRRRLAAVLTIPAMFDMPQRLAFAKLTQHAGLTVRRVVETPVAALVAAGLPEHVRRVVAIDFGAGYFDICIAERTREGWNVLGAEGDTLLGTDDLDQRVMTLLSDGFMRQHDLDLSASGPAIAKLRRQARRIRLDVRKRQPPATVLTDVANDGGRSLPLVHPPLGARELESLWREELEALVPPCLRLFEDLGLGTDDIDALVILGGGGRLPFVQAQFEELLRLRAAVFESAPMLAARGAARLAAADEDGVTVRSVLPHTLSVREDDRPPVPISRKNQPLPISSTHFYKPSAADSGPTDLWLCQGEREHGYDAFRVARAHLEREPYASYVVEINVDLLGGVAFHVQPSAALGLDQKGGPETPSSIPPMSEGSPRIVVNVDSMDERSLAAYLATLEEDEDEDAFGGQPTIAARRVDSDSVPAPSSRPDRALRRSMFGRAQVNEVVTSSKLPRSTQLDTSGPVSLRTADDPLVGKVLGGRYEVSAILGEGAMARVYIARHSILGAKYAVKVMHPNLATDASLRERFLREARAAAAIESDHVVRILDFGQADDGRDYFVMEYLEGSSLEQEIQERLVPMPLVLTAMTHVARGLEAAHQHNIVHRDLKPENVWITQVGSATRVKILDFGVAKIPTAEAGLTMGNSIIGTPYYMAPEQVTGEVDTRTDIYAAGIMMYELVTGRLPFNHESLAFVLAMQCEAPLPSPREQAGPHRCSVELERLILKCAEKRKEDRFQSASELRAALEAIAVAR